MLGEYNSVIVLLSHKKILENHTKIEERNHVTGSQNSSHNRSRIHVPLSSCSLGQRQLILTRFLAPEMMGPKLANRNLIVPQRCSCEELCSLYCSRTEKFPYCSLWRKTHEHLQSSTYQHKSLFSANQQRQALFCPVLKKA